MAEAKMMRAVVFHGPHSVTVEQRPIPTIRDDGDIIVEVGYSALCGSELHVYRGHQASAANFIMGHEFTGKVVQISPSVRTVSIGDEIVCPFTTSCGKCYYCLGGHTSRCSSSLLFGSPALDGAQAQFVRVPLADGTVVKAPAGIPPTTLILMADIFPTGFFAARNAFAGLAAAEVHDCTAVVIGCGPVGLCAVVAAAMEWKPRLLIAVDCVSERLERARSLGAEPWDFKTDREGLMRRVKEATGGRGADVVMEVVGNSSALRLAFDLLRPWGMLSSVGVHNREMPWSGSEAYAKNLRLQMGRCPVRGIFKEALEVLVRRQEVFGFMADQVMPLTQAVEAYDLFDKMKVQKVIFEAQR